MTTSSRWLTPAVWFFYAVVAFEFLFMITPFALYFYSAYAPALGWLNASPWTSWMSAFFLPHFCLTESRLLNGLRASGWMLAYAGLILFLVSAVQLYGAKLFRQGAVTGWLYRYVRHPQYLALAVLSLGLALLWPRFVVLPTVVTMLFLYRTLARIEERRCMEKYGDDYLEYQRRTGMFLPRLFKSGGFDARSRQRPHSAWRSFAAYLVALLLAIGAGFGLREHSLSSISAVFLEDATVVSPAILTQTELERSFLVASSASEVLPLLQSEHAPRLVYVVPADWYMPDLPIDPHDQVRKRGGHGTPTDFDRHRYRVLFMKAHSHGVAPTFREILRRTFRTEPLLLVDVDLAIPAVTGVSEPPSGVIWGEIAPPLF